MKQASRNKTQDGATGEGSHTFRNHNHTLRPREDDTREKTWACMSLSKYILKVY